MAVIEAFCKTRLMDFVMFRSTLNQEFNIFIPLKHMN
jgi:hypothetical protein